jgi:nuclear pore complex protein Nup205
VYVKHVHCFILQMLALSVLNMVTSIDRRGDWLKRAVSRGYLQHIVDGLLADDQQLQACLAPQPVSLKALYIFEAKMVGSA